MKRLEQMLANTIRREHYSYLVREIKRNKLVVFFGAGLSLWRTYSYWSYPFDWTQKQVEKKYEELKKYYKSHQKDEEARRKMRQVRRKLTDGKNSNDYLIWGDLLDHAITALHDLYNETELVGRFHFRSFNDACVSAFSDAGAPPVFEIPYRIPPIFFLPYLSRLLVTTNVDTSFEETCKKIGNTEWNQVAIHPNSGDIIGKWNAPQHAIYYIHGHINEPESLVMTQKEYSRMYPEIIPAYGSVPGSRKLLRDIIKKYSILFLGASLQEDRTVKVINYEAKQAEIIAARGNDDLRFLPITQILPNGRLSKAPKLIDYNPITYSDSKHCEISSLLLQSVRATLTTWKNCSWRPPELYESDIPISSDLRTDILNSLSRASTFEIIDPKESSPSSVIRYLYENHSIYRDDFDDNGWSICCIKNKDFSLDGYRADLNESFSPLHNYPLGDTVYVLLGDINLSIEDENQIVSRITDWHASHFVPIRTSDPEENGVIIPRIRIIVFSPKRFVLTDEDISKLFDGFIRYRDSFATLSKEAKIKLAQWIIWNNTDPSFRMLMESIRQSDENAKDNVGENNLAVTKEDFPYLRKTK